MSSSAARAGTGTLSADAALPTTADVIAGLPWRWRVQGSIFLVGGLGFMFDAWDVALNGFLIPLLSDHWSLSVGQAAWIYEKFQAWTDNQGQPEDALDLDHMLDNISIYWFSNAAASSARLYWESFRHLARSKITLPAGFSTFPKEMAPAPRSWVEANVGNIVYWNELDRGGHFAAWEQPELFVGELRACFALMR